MRRKNQIRHQIIKKRQFLRAQAKTKKQQKVISLKVSDQEGYKRAPILPRVRQRNLQTALHKDLHQSHQNRLNRKVSQIQNQVLLTKKMVPP
jgi:hypothetical protein